ncbi:hypothetical protein MXB_738, partial [Myxobolus squamalis]
FFDKIICTATYQFIASTDEFTIEYLNLTCAILRKHFITFNIIPGLATTLYKIFINEWRNRSRLMEAISKTLAILVLSAMNDKIVLNLKHTIHLSIHEHAKHLTLVVCEIFWRCQKCDSTHAKISVLLLVSRIMLNCFNQFSDHISDLLNLLCACGTASDKSVQLACCHEIRLLLDNETIKNYFIKICTRIISNESPSRNDMCTIITFLTVFDNNIPTQSFYLDKSISTKPSMLVFFDLVNDFIGNNIDYIIDSARRNLDIHFSACNSITILRVVIDFFPSEKLLTHYTLDSIRVLLKMVSQFQESGLCFAFPVFSSYINAILKFYPPKVKK